MFERLKKLFKPDRGVELRKRSDEYELVIWQNREANILRIPEGVLNEFAIKLCSLKAKGAQLIVDYGYYEEYIDVPKWAIQEIRRLIVNAVLQKDMDNDKCRNCGAPLEKCGPELWEKQKKCCPECTHWEES